MRKVNNGYVFDVKRVKVQDDGQIVVGIKEEYNTMRTSATSMRVRATFGVDFEMTPTRPAYAQSDLGLVSLYDYIMRGNIIAGMQSFLRSHKAVYSINTATYLICSLSGHIDLSTLDWEADVVVEFYTMRSLVKDIFDGADGVLCEKLSSSAGLNIVKVNDAYLKMMTSVLLARVKPYISSKEKFLFARMGINA